MITVHCPKCRAELEFPDSLVGQSDVCPDCQSPVTVQRPAASRAVKVKRKRGAFSYIFWPIFGALSLVALWWCLTFTDPAIDKMDRTYSQLNREGRRWHEIMSLPRRQRWAEFLVESQRDLDAAESDLRRLRR